MLVKETMLSKLIFLTSNYARLNTMDDIFTSSENSIFTDLILFIVIIVDPRIVSLDFRTLNVIFLRDYGKTTTILTN